MMDFAHVHGVPLFPSPGGNVFFVHASGSSTVSGRDIDRPLSTIDAAINQCTAASATRIGTDFIYVLPGHTETIAAANGFDLDVAGVEILGLGRGALRPTLTLGSSTAAATAVGANGTALANILYIAAIDSLATCLDIDATTGFLGVALEFRDASSIGIVDTIDLADEVDIHLKDIRFEELDTGIGQSCILGTTPNRLVIDGCVADKDAQTGLIELGNATQCRIINNWLETTATEDLAIVGGSSITGWVDNNKIRLADDAANITECITVSANWQLGRNWVVNADGERALEHNGTQSTD